MCEFYMISPFERYQILSMNIFCSIDENLKKYNFETKSFELFIVSKK